MSELIGAMCLAYDSTYSLKGHVPAMTAAARVIADALLGPVTDEERKQFRELVGFVPSVVDTFLYARRDRKTHV